MKLFATFAILFSLEALHAQQASQAQALQAQAAAAGPLAAQPVPDLAIVARVDGKDITAGEVRNAIATMPPEFTRLFQQNPKYAVQQIFVMRHLADEAEKSKLAEKSPTKEQLEAVRANILASAMVSHEHNNYIVPAEAMKAYYLKESQRFRKAEIKVIALAFKQEIAGAVASSLEDIARGVAAGATGQAVRNDAQTKQLASDLMKQLREGADFAKLAGEYSDDPTSKAKGGEAQPITADSSHPEEWRKSVFAVQPGELVGPLRQGNSYFIVRLEKISVQPMEQVQEPIVQAIKQQHVNSWFQEVNKRFEPELKNLQFFTQTGAPPVPASPAK